MSNKVAVITGASGGLAQEVILTMLNSKFNVVAINRNNEFNYSFFENEAKLNGVNFSIYTADLSNEESIASAVNNILIENQRIDAIIHLAGISYSGMSWKQSVENWKEILDINLTGPMLVSKYLIPQMKKQQDGCIIYFSSIVAHRPIAGTEGLTKTQAIELGGSNIRVNCIAPGYIDAGMIREVNDTIRHELIQSTPLKSLGNPKTIAETVLYLCSIGGSFTTGQVLHINGGLFI